MVKSLGAGGVVVLASSLGGGSTLFILAVVAMFVICVVLFLLIYVVAMFAPHRAHALGVLDRLVALVVAARRADVAGKGS